MGLFVRLVICGVDFFILLVCVSKWFRGGYEFLIFCGVELGFCLGWVCGCRLILFVGVSVLAYGVLGWLDAFVFLFMFVLY